MRNGLSRLKLQLLLPVVFFTSTALVSESAYSNTLSCSVVHKKIDSEQVLNLRNYVENYSELIPTVKEMIELGLERFGNKQPKGYCYRAVKGLLLDSGLVKVAIEGTFASSAHTKNFLVNRGFINLLERAPFQQEIRGALDPKIPDGAILVYEGTNGLDGTERPLGQGIGHIEIKCGSNCYLFDGVKEYPGGFGQFTQAGTMEAGSGIQKRRLIGVYIMDYFSLF